ncbi:MAG: hypothetical protein ISS70_01325 [Phycisphaerae bacterium]|nr:hypothetical protein [Phycisphaerae bacterium]
MKSRISFVLVGIVCVGLAGTSPAEADVLYVKADAAGSGDGTTWADAYTDLQVALAVAEPGSDIWVAAGTYQPGGPGDRTATFQLRSGIGIYGGFAGTEVSRSERSPATNLTVLSGDLNGNDLEVLEPAELASKSTRSDNSYHVVTGSGTNKAAVLDGVVVTGGNANGTGAGDSNGGGMTNRSGAATLINCTFEWNVASRSGGGLFNSGGALDLVHCTFRDNHVIGSSQQDTGGAGLCNFSASPTVTGCTFSRNTSDSRGAGMYNQSAAPTISQCIFEDNAVLGNYGTSIGGGMLNAFGGSNADVRQCVFTGNSAPFGGGMFNGTNSGPTISQCLFNWNRAVHATAGIGGGMQNWESQPTVINCTFSENTAVDWAGGLGAQAGASPIVANCIFWGNSAARPGQVGGPNASIVSYSCVQGGLAGDGNIDTDPHFADPQNGDYRLKSQTGRWDPLGESWTQDDITSPCIDGGDPMSPIDLEPFPTGGFVNMGAYGGTPQASKPYFGHQAPCESIVAGDLNGDCQVDRADLAIMALHWTDPEPMQP